MTADITGPIRVTKRGEATAHHSEDVADWKPAWDNWRRVPEYGQDRLINEVARYIGKGGFGIEAEASLLPVFSRLLGIPETTVRVDSFLARLHLARAVADAAHVAPEAAYVLVTGDWRPRAELVVAAQPRVMDLVRAALAGSRVDWRTPRSLAKELGVSEVEVRTVLKSLGEEVRQPIAARGDEHNYFRLTKRGKTWQERLRWLLLALGRTPPDKIR
jgi:hypothetical protein